MSIGKELKNAARTSLQSGYQPLHDKTNARGGHQPPTTKPTQRSPTACDKGNEAAPHHTTVTCHCCPFGQIGPRGTKETTHAFLLRSYFKPNTLTPPRADMAMPTTGERTGKPSRPTLLQQVAEGGGDHPSSPLRDRRPSDLTSLHAHCCCIGCPA